MLRRFAIALVVGAFAIVPACALAGPMSLSVTKVGPQDGGGEPSIAGGPEGNLYVSYPSSSGMSFFRSTDGGSSWVKGGIADSGSGDTSVNVDSSGAVYQANLNGNEDELPLQADVWKSTDFGQTWPQRGVGPDENDSTGNPFLVDRQWTDAWIPPGKTTNDAQVYLEYHDFGPSQVWVAKSSDGGKTFGLPVPVSAASPDAEAATFCNSIPGGVKVVPSGPHAGRIYAAWLAGDAATNVGTGCNDTQLETFHTIWIAWSDDGGQTWTPKLIFDGGFGHDASALFADMALDTQGNPYVAFGQNLNDEWDMFVEASGDGGKTWNGKSDGSGQPYKVNSDTGTHFFPAITAGDPGHVDVAWIGTSTKIQTLPYGKPAPGGGAGAVWYVYAAQSADVLSGKPHWDVTKVTPDPIHTGDVCTLGIFCIPGVSDRDLLDFIDIALDPKGAAHVAYTADTPKDTGIYSANQTGGDTVLIPAGAPADTSYAQVLGSKTTHKAHKKKRHHHKKKRHHKKRKHSAAKKRGTTRR